ncbi:unnamed protein product, partial [marine sediment metagenome]
IKPFSEGIEEFDFYKELSSAEFDKAVKDEARKQKIPGIKTSLWRAKLKKWEGILRGKEHKSLPALKSWYKSLSEDHQETLEKVIVSEKVSSPDDFLTIKEWEADLSKEWGGKENLGRMKTIIKLVYPIFSRADLSMAEDKFKPFSETVNQRMEEEVKGFGEKEAKPPSWRPKKPIREIGVAEQDRITKHIDNAISKYVKSTPVKLKGFKNMDKALQSALQKHRIWDITGEASDILWESPNRQILEKTKDAYKSKEFQDAIQKFLK